MHSRRPRAALCPRGALGALSLASLTLTLWSAPARAAAPERQECVDAHSQGQDLRDRGKLVEARDAFLLCAQSSCPPLVQADCATFSAEVARLVPSVSFGARSPDGKDLPATAVYVDGVMTAQRLDDGKVYDINPGKHQVRFVHDGRDVTQDLVVTQGDKGRSVIVTFPSPTPAAPAAPAAAPAPPPPAPPASEPPAARRPLAPLIVAVGGGVLLLGGAALTLYGRSQLPDSCQLSNHQCVAAPGSDDFSDASRSARTMNVGFAVGGVGAAAAVSGLLWYFLSPSSGALSSQALGPWMPAGGAGLQLHRRF